MDLASAAAKAQPAAAKAQPAGPPDGGLLNPASAQRTEGSRWRAATPHGRRVTINVPAAEADPVEVKARIWMPAEGCLGHKMNGWDVIGMRAQLLEI